MELEDIKIVINAYKQLLKKFTDLGASEEICKYYNDEVIYWQKRKENFNNCLDASAGDCL